MYPSPDALPSSYKDTNQVGRELTFVASFEFGQSYKELLPNTVCLPSSPSFPRTASFSPHLFLKQASCASKIILPVLLSFKLLGYLCRMLSPHNHSEHPSQGTPLAWGKSLCVPLCPSVYAIPLVQFHIWPSFLHSTCHYGMLYCISVHLFVVFSH